MRNARSIRYSSKQRDTHQRVAVNVGTNRERWRRRRAQHGVRRHRVRSIGSSQRYKGGSFAHTIGRTHKPAAACRRSAQAHHTRIVGKRTSTQQYQTFLPSTATMLLSALFVPPIYALRRHLRAVFCEHDTAETQSTLLQSTGRRDTKTPCCCTPRCTKVQVMLCKRSVGRCVERQRQSERRSQTQRRMSQQQRFAALNRLQL